MNTNRISQDFSEELMNQMLQKIEELYNLFPAHISLSEEERHGGFRLGDKSMGFLEKGKQYVDQAPQFAPQYFDKEEAFRDSNFTIRSITVARRLNTVLTELQDMATIAGMEAMSAMLSYYNSVKNATKDGIPGAKPIYDDLSKRFQPSAKPAEEPKK